MINNFIWSLKELNKFKRSYLFVLVLDALVKGITPVASLILIQRLIDLIQYQVGTLQQAVIWLVLVSVVQLLSELILIITNVKLSNYELDFERHFQERIYSKVSDLSSIIIMHRFNYMVRCADKIVVLKNGEITEMGTHEQLVEKKGLYNDLYYMHLEINSKDKVYDMG